MIKFLGTRNSGKTTDMVTTVLQNAKGTVYFVTNYPSYIKDIIQKIQPTQNVEVLNYRDFLNHKDSLDAHAQVYIDEIEGLLQALDYRIQGFNMSLEEFQMRG